LFGCGKEAKEGSSSEVTEENPQTSHYTQLVQSEGDLPGCGEANNNQLIYVKDAELFKVCDGGSWADIDINGKDGVDGEDGANGADGADGQDGTDNRIIASIYCGGELESTGIYV